MIINRAIIVFISILLLSCKWTEKKIELKNEIINSKWEYEVTDGCVNYIRFKTKDYIEYNCELDFEFSGNYKVSGDTLEVTEIGLASELSVNAAEVVKNKRKYILKDGSLIVVAEAEGVKGVWKNFTPAKQAVGVYRKVIESKP